MTTLSTARRVARASRPRPGSHGRSLLTDRLAVQAPTQLLLQRWSSSSSSSSSTSSTPEPLQTGWQAQWDTFARNLFRLPRFAEYEAQQVFSPALSVIHHAMLLYTLHAPQRVDLDVYEFLQGAEWASQQVLMDTNSAEFAAYASGQTSGSNEVVKRMEAYCTPHCFQQLMRSVKRNMDKNLLIESLDVQIHNVCLTRGAYARLTEDEYAEELRGMRWSPQSLREHDEDATLERLQLLVEIRVRERLQRTTSAREVVVVDQDCVYLSRFTSRVTTDDELDWRLDAIALRTRGRQREISRTRLPSPSE